MIKYLNIIIGICLVAFPALGADSLKKINKPYNFGELTIEERWYPRRTFEIRETFSDNRRKDFKSNSTIDIWKSDSISVPLTVRIKKFDIPKVRLTFTATF